MATGPEHYRTAEALLIGQRSAPRGTPEDQGILAEAQVHATLALVAATVSPTMDWRAVLAEPSGGEGHDHRRR